MPRMNPQEAAHYSRMAAALVSTYRAWGKGKPNLEYIESLAADFGDRAVRSLRERQRRSNGKR